MCGIKKSSFSVWSTLLIFCAKALGSAKCRLGLSNLEFTDY